MTQQKYDMTVYERMGLTESEFGSLLKDLYDNGESQRSIAKKLKCSVTTIETWFKKFQIKTRSLKEARAVTTFGNSFCVDCSLEFCRNAPHQVRCAHCGPIHNSKVRRKNQRRYYHQHKNVVQSIGDDIDCEKCGVTIKFNSGGHKYCETCRMIVKQEIAQRVYEKKEARRKKRIELRRKQVMQCKCGDTFDHYDGTSYQNFCDKCLEVRSKLSALVHNCKNREKPVGPKFTFENLFELYLIQKGKCAISGLSMILECGNLCTMSIDRINNDQGYSIDNVHLVCKWVNLGRGPHSVQEMREVLGAIIAYPSPDLVLPEVQ